MALEISQKHMTDQVLLTFISKLSIFPSYGSKVITEASKRPLHMSDSIFYKLGFVRTLI